MVYYRLRTTIIAQKLGCFKPKIYWVFSKLTASADLKRAPMLGTTHEAMTNGAINTLIKKNVTKLVFQYCTTINSGCVTLKLEITGQNNSYTATRPVVTAHSM
jgi:hypothetical protein